MKQITTDFRHDLNPEAAGRHEYSIEATKVFDGLVELTERDLRIVANSRSQAAAIAKRKGYTVRSVNLIG